MFFTESELQSIVRSEGASLLVAAQTSLLPDRKGLT